MRPGRLARAPGAALPLPHHDRSQRQPLLQPGGAGQPRLRRHLRRCGPTTAARRPPCSAAAALVGAAAAARANNKRAFIRNKPSPRPARLGCWGASAIASSQPFGHTPQRTTISPDLIRMRSCRLRTLCPCCLPAWTLLCNEHTHSSFPPAAAPWRRPRLCSPSLLETNRLLGPSYTSTCASYHVRTYFLAAGRRSSGAHGATTRRAPAAALHSSRHALHRKH